MRAALLCCALAACPVPGYANGAAPATAALKVIDGADPSAIKLSPPSTELFYAVRLENTTAKQLDLQVEVAPFIGPDGKSYGAAWTVDGKPVPDGKTTIPTLGAVWLGIQATLTPVGRYSGAYSLIYDGQRTSRALVVDRSRVPTPIEILGVDASDRPELAFTVRNTSGQDVTLEQPAVLTLTLSRINGTKFQARYDSVQFQDANGGRLDARWKLDADATRSLKMTVAGLRDAGDYRGVLRVAAPGMEPKDQPFTILLRHGWLCAAASILIGVVASQLLRTYTTSTRPRLVSLRRLSALLGDIDKLEARLGADVTTEERATLDAQRRALEHLQDAVDLRNTVDAEAILNQIDQKLSVISDWVTARRRVDHLAPASLQAQFRQTLDQAGRTLLDPLAIPAAIDQARNALLGLSGAMQTAVRDALLKQIDEFQKAVDEVRKGASPALDAFLTDEVLPKIDTARRVAQADRAEASARYEEAYASYVDALLRELESSLATRPAAFDKDPQRWLEMQARVRERIHRAREAQDATSAMNSYQLAYRVYLQGLAAALEARIAEQTIDAQRLADPRKTDLSTRLAQLNGGLAAAAQLVQQGNLREAASAYSGIERDYVKMYNELVATIPGAMGQAFAPMLAPPAVTATGVALEPAAAEQPGVVAESRAPRGELRVKALGKWLTRLDLAFTGVVLLVAVGLGLKLLWLDNATWGSYGDYLVALLWGLGLHQVSGAAFEGIPGLTLKLTK